MMRRLILLRHAKSSWDDPDLDDHARPLSPRGRKAAPAVGAWLLDQGFIPERILSSDSVRTRQTVKRVTDVWRREGGLPSISFRPSLYLASPAGILRAVADEGNEVASIMVVGHNPGMHDLAHALAGPGKARAHRRLAEKFPTAAVAVLDFDAESWGELRRGDGRLVAFQRPRDLAGGGR